MSQLTDSKNICVVLLREFQLFSRVYHVIELIEYCFMVDIECFISFSQKSELLRDGAFV